MLTNQAQQKIISSLLKRPQNQYCSDCNGKSPCWASLDFGVFVCMNCSGAHRALGPSITRVRSTKLDIWNKDWVENMKIGNSILNQYWECQLADHPSNVKPNVNSSLNQIKKFVHDKYVKRKFVDSSDNLDPLAKLKKGLNISNVKPEKDNQTSKPNVQSSQFPTKEIAPKQTPKKHQYHTVKQSTLPFSKEDVFKKLKTPENPQVSSNKKIDDDLLQFHQNDGAKEITPHHLTKKFDFNFNDLQNEKQKQNEPIEQKVKDIGFDNFLQNISNKSESSGERQYTYQQPIHGNYFMSPNSFINSSNISHPLQQHGYSLPSHHQHAPQVTMNINMNMYPNVMNINMGTMQQPTYPSMGHYQGAVHNNPTTQNKQFQYNDFFTGNISPPPQNITLEVTLNQKKNEQSQQEKVRKEKSWVDDWM